MNANTPLKYTRLANLRDVPKIAEMAETLVRTTGYSDIPADTKKLLKMVETFIIQQPKDTVMLVSVDDKDRVVGFLAAMTFQLMHSVEPVAIEVGWFTEPTADNWSKRNTELRSGYEEWARRQGMRYAQYATLNPTEKDIQDLTKNKKATVLELVYHRRLDKETS